MILKLTYLLATLCVASALPNFAATASFTGTVPTPEDTVSIVVHLSFSGSLALQTYGFGGGTNAHGQVIPAGGFDPFVGLFSGLGDSAVFIDGTSDILSNYTPGCPPAGTTTVGSVSGVCGDAHMTFSGLTPGFYTVLLSDGAYLPNAVFESSPALLGDGFSDLTGGVFQTCATGSDCNLDSGNWALDIGLPEGGVAAIASTPEPSTWMLASAAVVMLLRRRKS
jgi:uncharacterized protein (TIGR03382 family)